MYTKNIKIRVLMLCKEDKTVVETAVNYLSNLISSGLYVYRGKVGDPLPEDLEWLEYDYIISFLSPWIVPDYLIKKVHGRAINFHPGPPEYPGTGCFNFALYDCVATYGTTCHFMKQLVDSGDIIAVKRFKVYPEDSVSTLLEKTYAYMLILFYEIIEQILSGRGLPQAGQERWKGKARTRKELEALCELSDDMDREEVKRRIKATSFPGMPGPRLNFHGYLFKIAED